MKRALEAWPTALGQTASNHGRKLIRPAQRHGRNDHFRRYLAVGLYNREGPLTTHLGSSPLSREGPVWDQEEPFLE